MAAGYTGDSEMSAPLISQTFVPVSAFVMRLWQATHLRWVEPYIRAVPARLNVCEWSNFAALFGHALGRIPGAQILVELICEACNRL